MKKENLKKKIESEKLGEEDAYAKILQNLRRYISSGGGELLEDSIKYAKKTECPACVKYMDKLLNLHEGGEYEEARGWARKWIEKYAE